MPDICDHTCTDPDGVTRHCPRPRGHDLHGDDDWTWTPSHPRAPLADHAAAEEQVRRIIADHCPTVGAHIPHAPYIDAVLTALGDRGPDVIRLAVDTSMDCRVAAELIWWSADDPDTGVCHWSDGLRLSWSLPEGWSVGPVRAPLLHIPLSPSPLPLPVYAAPDTVAAAVRGLLADDWPAPSDACWDGAAALAGHVRDRGGDA